MLSEKWPERMDRARELALMTPACSLQQAAPSLIFPPRQLQAQVSTIQENHAALQTVVRQPNAPANNRKSFRRHSQHEHISEQIKHAPTQVHGMPTAHKQKLPDNIQLDEHALSPLKTSPLADGHLCS
jgi:hypothetical protein